MTLCSTTEGPCACGGWHTSIKTLWGSSAASMISWGAHEAGARARALGYTTLVLVASELQDLDGARAATGIRIVKQPYDDSVDLADRPTFRARVFETAASLAPGLVKGGERILVTCHMGVSRSALMAAAIRHAATGESGDRILADMPGGENGMNRGFRDWVRQW